ncbi:O-acyltransferase WSD1 [Dichanthelium oligosanthes]|uniref:O-acyltransferase WSD1 n=1 Tax=Dichanthelium oligosanthes TaxID=888268 RepID=A0A1E5UVV2_9POAL|nr:O-acyltransferase WSD1 [Dichanthelium oligosanthes]
MTSDLYIVAVLGLDAPIDLQQARAGLEVTLVRHPRFCSIRAMDGPEPRWVRTTVNLDDHIVIPNLDPAAIVSNADKVLEDYVASLSTLPMDQSRQLWELHVLDFPTSEAASAAVFRINHALGDGTSLISLLLACTRSAADPKALPAMPSATPPPAQRRRKGRPVYGASPRPAWSAGGALALAAWVTSCVLLAWHTLVDVVRFVALAMNLVRDPRTVFTGVKGVEFRRKRFVSRGLSLADVKLVKNALGCTVNDVLVGVTSAALSRYYFQKPSEYSVLTGSHATKKSVFLTSLLMVNVRSTPGIQELAQMMESSKHNDVKWGNQVGQIILPFHIALHDDPLEYVRKAKKIVDRKKHSFEVMFTYGIGKTATELFGAKVSGAIFHRMISNTTMPFSNMIGPVEQVEFYGHRVVYIAPSVYGHPSALTILWQSYADTIRVVLAVDDAQFPDCRQLLDDFTESLKLISDAASAKQ